MLTPADVSALVGPDVFARGAGYLSSGHVLSVARNGDGTTIVGHVRGAPGKQYVAVAEMSGPGEQATPRYGHCSCPVRLNCKHVAAVLLAYCDKVAGTAVTTAGRARPTQEWEETFASLLEVPDDAPAATAAGRAPGPDGRAVAHEIALQLELLPVAATGRDRRTGRSMLTSGPGVSLGMRPVVRGARGRWVRTGISWTELRYLNYRRLDYPESHVDVLRSLYGLASTLSDSDYAQAVQWILADTLPSAALWALLDEARRDGLPIVQADKAQTPVTFPAQPPTTGLAVLRTAGGLAVSATVTLPGDVSPLDRATTVLLGSPTTGLFAWSEGRVPTKESPLLLARFAAPLDESARSLLERTAPLTVPAADERRFLARVVPALQESFDTVDLDPGIDLPERPRPYLQLDVTHLPEHGARLEWQWRYAVPGPGSDAAADGRDDENAVPEIPAFPVGAVLAHPLRDVEAEERILDRVSAAAPRLRRLREMHAARRTRPAARGREIFAQAASGVGQEELRGIETAEFFTGELPALHELARDDAEFDVVVSSDGVEGVMYRFEPDVEVSVTTSTLPDKRDWFDLGILVRVREHQVPLADVFTALALGKTKILLVDGLHFSLEDERFDRLRELIDEARALQDTMGGPLRVNRFQAGLFEELEHLGVIGAQAETWRSSLGALTAGARPEHVEPPVGLRAQLRSYQQQGFEWLAFLYRNGLGGILADDMGLGKTLEALALVQHVHEAAPRRRPFLVVAPTSVVGNWAAEVRHFTPDLTAATVTETRARRKVPLADVVGGADVVVTSYALFRLDFAEYEALEWAGLILDEAQFVKNHQSVAYQCARRLDVPFKLALTGTPLENTLMELWSILSIVSPGLFPSPVRFTEYYARPIEKERSAPRLAQLRRRVSPFMLRRTKEEVATDLPAKQEQVVEVTLNSRHRELYDQYLQRERTKVLGLVEEFGEHRFEVFRSLTVLRQASLDVSLVDEEHHRVPSSKLGVLFEMFDDILAEGHSVLIFSQFTQFLGRVRAHLDKASVDYSYLDGRTRKRTETIERFTSGETKVFLISLKAGGFGLNLTAADYCFLLDPWWNPAAEAQAVDRAHRIGQQRNVMVYRMVSTDTIEEKVMALKASKSELFASVLDGAGASGGASLTAGDVRELLE